MAFDIKNFYERNKDYYGDVPLEDVAKDAFTRSGMDQKYSYDDWKQQIGIAPIVEEDAYQRQVQKARMDTPGIFGELGRSLMRGVTQTVPQSIGKGIQWLNPDSGGIQAVEEAGKTIERFGDANVKRFPGITMSKAAEEAGDWNPRKWVASAGESIAQSVTPIIVGAAGAAIGGPVAGVAAGLGTLGGMFYAGTAEDTYRSAKEKGLSDEDAMNLANITGGVEAGGELVADLIPIKIFGGLGKAAKGSIIKSLTSRKPVKAMIGDVARTIVGEELTESGQQAIQTYAAEKYGVADQGVMESVAEVWGPTLITSLMFGAGGIGYNSAHRAKVRKALANPNVNPEERVNAVMEVTKAANDVDPTVGKNFFNQASRLLSENKPVIIDDDEFYNIGSIPAPGGITDEKRVAEIGDTPTPQPMTGPVTSELSNAGVVPKPKPAAVQEVQPVEEPVQEYGPPPNIQSLVDSRRDVLAEDARMQQANQEPRGRRGLSMGGLAPTKRYQEAIKEVADKGTIPDVQDTLQAIRDDATERINGEKASEVGQEVQGNIAPLANPETGLPEQAGNEPAGEAPVEATPAEPVTQPIAGSEAGLKAGSKPLEAADEVQAGEEPASISTEETFPSMTLPIEQIRKLLVDKLNERKENGDKLPVDLRNKTPEKYVEQMPERMARDWYSSIFETGATPNAQEKSQETQTLLEQTPGKPPESEPVVPPSVSAVPSEQGLPASGREGGSQKQPWEMTRQEFDQYWVDKTNAQVAKEVDAKIQKLNQYKNTLQKTIDNDPHDPGNQQKIAEIERLNSEIQAQENRKLAPVVKPSEFMSDAQFRFHQGIDARLSEGKPIPPEVLADYPDLKPKADQPSAQTVAPPSEKAEVASGPKPVYLMTRDEYAKFDMEHSPTDQYRVTINGETYTERPIAVHKDRSVTLDIFGHKRFRPDQYEKINTPQKRYAKHRLDVYNALQFNKMTPADYTRLHEKDYGPIEKFAPGVVKVEPAPQPKTKPKLSPVESMTGKRESAAEKMARENPDANFALLMADMRKTKPRPIAKKFGSKGPTPEQLARHNEEVRKWNREYRVLSEAHKIALPISNAKFRAKQLENEQPSQSTPQAQQNDRGDAQRPEGIQTPASKIEKAGLRSKGKAAAEKTGKAVYTTPDFSDSAKAKTTGIPATQARTEFASFTQAVKKSGHKIEFHDSLNDVPNGKAKSKAQSHEASTGRYVRAFYDRDTDTSHIITGRLDSMNDVVKVLCHESIGHSGLYKFMGSDLTPFLDFVLRHPGYGLDIKKVAKSRGIDFISTEGRYQAAKEWFAEITEKGDIQPTLLSRLVVAFKNALRRLGVKAEWLVGFSDKDVAEIIRGSRNAIIGKGAKYRDAGLIGKPVGGLAVDYQDVFHGTPHVWPPEPGFPHGRPRLDKIGSGQGAATFGHGWYSAEAEAVGRQYKNELSSVKYERNGIAYPTYDTLPLLKAIYKEHQIQPEDYMTFEFGMDKGLKEGKEYFDSEKRFYSEEYKKAESDYQKAMYQHLIDKFGKFSDIISEIKEIGGAVYKLDIPNSVLPKLLDWDKPLSEQSEYVKEALEKHFGDAVVDDGGVKLYDRFGVWESKDLSGERLYFDIAEKLANKANLEADAFFENVRNKYGLGKNDNVYASMSEAERAELERLNQLTTEFVDKKKAASEYLASIGIPGNKYLDGMSRDKGTGSYNYVIWDQKVLDQIALLERNGEKLDAMREAEQADYSDLPEADPRIDYSDSPQGQANQAAAAPFTGFENRVMAQIKTWLLKHGMDERWEKFAMWLYDDKKALLTVQKTLAAQPTFRDYNMLSRLMGSAITNEVKRLDRDYIKPLLQHMADNKLKTKDVEELAYAKHAPAFNLQMKRVNAKRYIDALIDNMTEAEAMPYKERVDDIRSRFKKADPENSDLSVNDLRDEYVALLDGMAVEVAGKEGAIAAEIDKRQSDLDSRAFTEQERREGKRGHLQKLIDNARYRLDQRAKLASQWESEKDRLSGITNEQAAEIEKKWAGNNAAQKAVAMLREIDDKSLDLLVEGGEITAEEAAVQRYTYPNHVPLMRENWADSKTQTGLAGTGPISRPLKRAGGSTKGVVNIFANVVDRHQAYISRKHKGVAGKALYEMVKANPDETKWSIEERPKKLTYDYEGNARFIYEDSTINREYQTIVKVNGKQHVITVPHDNPTMTRFIEAINRTPRELGPFMRGSAKIVRFMAGLNTSFAPEFLMTNFARDLQQAMVNLEDSEAKGLQKEVFKNIKAAIKGIYQSERGNESGEWAKIYAEYAKHGGKIGWMQPHENVAELAKSLEKELAYKEGKHPNIEKLRKLKSWVEAMNTAVENGVRLATYQALVKKGIDPKKAAYTAKTLTVDFTQHGTAGPAINSLYMFANAGIQGNVRTIKAIASSPKVRKLVTGIIGFGAMANIMGIMMGGDDDDGESYYDKLKHTNPDIFERNMVFMIPGTKGKYFKIPMPYGYNVFFVLGNEAASALRGKSPAESTARIGSALLGTLNPLQAATLLQTVMPTIGDPIAQWKENKAWHGGPLMPEKNPFGIPVPESERYFKSVNPVAKGIAQGLNSLTGGNKNKSGLIDVSPELFDMVFETYTGSAGRLVKDALSLPAAALSDDGVAANKVPFLRKVLGTYSDRTDRTIYRERSNEVGTLANRYKQSVDEKEKAELRKDPLFAMIPMHKQTDKQLLRLNKMLKLSEKMGNKEQAEKIRDRMTAIKIAYDKKYNELTK